MSVVPMRLLTIAGPLELLDTVLASCVINQEFHPEYILSLMKDLSNLRPFEMDNPYQPLLRQAEDLADKMGLDLTYAPFEGKPNLPEIQVYFDQLSTTLEGMEHRREEASNTITHNKNVAEQVEHLQGVSGQLDALWGMTFARFRYGYMPRETYDSFQETLHSQEDLFFLPTSTEAKRVYGVYFTTNAAHRRVDTLLNSLHFVRIHIDAHLSGTVEDALSSLKDGVVQAEQTLEALVDEERAQREAEGATLLSYHAALRYQNDAYDLRKYAAYSKETFYVTGWVPKTQVDSQMEILRAFPALSVVVDKAEDLPDITPPTKLKNGFFAKVFSPFLEMYGTPSYNEIDPTFFMAFTYCLFFGIMFGDIGQGLTMALFGLVLTKWKKMWLGNILTCCGLSGAIFGCVYGNVFGNEHLLPGFKALEDGNVLILLIASLALGIVMLLTVMVLNIVNGVRQKNYEKILFGPNGAAGMIFYLGVIVAALSTLLLDINLFTPAYIIPVLVLPLVVILLKEPLSELMAGNPHWKHISVSEVLGIGLFELFEVLLSFLTNTLSFLRIGAYAIVHVGLMMVVYMLAGTGNIVVLVLGNIFVMGFEGLLVCIQVLRLEFYELFGRFYSGDGIPFQAKTIDYSAHINN